MSSTGSTPSVAHSERDVVWTWAHPSLPVARRIGDAAGAIAGGVLDGRVRVEAKGIGEGQRGVRGGGERNVLDSGIHLDQTTGTLRVRLWQEVVRA